VTIQRSIDASSSDDRGRQSKDPIQHQQNGRDLEVKENNNIEDVHLIDQEEHSFTATGSNEGKTNILDLGALKRLRVSTRLYNL